MSNDQVIDERFLMKDLLSGLPNFINICKQPKTNMRKSDDGYCDGSDSPPSLIPPTRLRTISASDRFCRNSKLHHNVFKSPTIDAGDADNLNAPLIDHVQPEKTNAAGLPRVSTGLCPVCVLCTSGDSGVSLTSTIKERTPTQILELKKAIESFANGSGHGLDELRPQHLKDMMSFSTGEAALSL
ncbi:hypothetical protein ACOME3_006500 [Neoechinorhynchus agilis]